jgi:GNAT superfamily N-acetyltransferase
LDQSFTIYEALYSRWSAYWLDQGCGTHVVSLLASDWDGVDGWQWLGFGMAVVDGVRDLSPLPVYGNGAYQVRQLQSNALGAFSPDDCALAARFDQALMAHVSAAPCFWPHDADEASTFNGAGWLAEPGNVLWIASQGDEPLGYLGITPSSQDACAIIRDPGTASIVKAYTLASARGKGVGAALLSQAISWAAEQGYQRCSVDYEAANPPARRFWGRWFEPVVFSLMRVITARIIENDEPISQT